MSWQVDSITCLNSVPMARGLTSSPRLSCRPRLLGHEHGQQTPAASSRRLFAMARRRTASRSPGHAAAVAGHAWSSGRRPGGTCLGGGGTPAGGGMSTTLPICVTSLTFTPASRATRTVRASCPDSTRSWPRRARRSVHLDQRARAPCGPRSPTAEHDRQYVLQAKFHDRGDFSGIIPEKSPRSWSVGFRVCCTLISAFLHRAGRSCLRALAYTWPLAGPL